MTLLEAIAANDHPNFYFIQIGANDGVKDDPLHDLICKNWYWRGLLVEPLPDVFQRLTATYGAQCHRLRWVNVAVSDYDGTVDFYRHPKHSVCSGLKIITAKQRKADMVKLEVLGLTFKTLMEVAKVPKLIDLLQVDTEGYDDKVIAQCLGELKYPSIIHYEHKHLSETARTSVTTLMISKGYAIYPEKFDTLAILDL